MLPVIPEVEKSIKLQETNNTILERVELTIQGLVTALTDQFNRDKFKEQENRRENESERPKSKSKKSKDDFNFDTSSLLSLATGLINKIAATTLLVAISTQLGIVDLVRIPKMLDIIGDSIKGLYNTVKLIVPSAESLGRLSTSFPRISASMSGITKGMKGMISFITKTVGIFSRLPGISSLLRAAKPLLTFVSGFGKVLFGPITLALFAIIDAVQGALSGYTEGGAWGAVKGAIIGVFNGLITKPLDLLKDIVSWAGEKLGFENFAATLDSFSFEKIATDLFNGVFDLGESIVTGVTKFFTDLGKTYEEGGLSALFQSFIGGAVDILVAKPFDLIKSAVSWVAEKLGFENFSNLLDSFSFSETYNKLINGAFTKGKELLASVLSIDPKEVMASIPGWIMNIPDFIKEELFTPLTNAVMDALPEISSFTLPKIITDFGGTVYNDVIKPVADLIFSMIPSIEDIKKRFADFSIKDLFNEMIENLKQRARDMLSSFVPDKNTISKRWNKLWGRTEEEVIEEEKKLSGDVPDTKKPRSNLLDSLTLDSTAIKERVFADYDAEQELKSIQNKLFTNIVPILKDAKEDKLYSGSGASVSIYNDNKATIYNTDNSSRNSSQSGGSATVTTRASPGSWAKAQ